MNHQAALTETQQDEEGSPLATRSGVARLRSYADISKSTTPIGSPKSELEGSSAAAGDQVVAADLQQVHPESHNEKGTDDAEGVEPHEGAKEAVRTEEKSQDGFEIE